MLVSSQSSWTGAGGALRSRGLALASSMLLWGVVGCGDQDTRSVSSSSTQTQELAGTGVVTEDTSDWYGTYLEVMAYIDDSNGDANPDPGTTKCTATVIGPYTVLTANHCGPRTHISWPYESETMVVSDWLVNPHSDSSLTFAPRWWAALNDQQIADGGRTTDWPAQHDLRVGFVPELTPEWLAYNRVFRNVPAASIDAHAPTNQQVAVGVCSGPCDDREYVDIDYTDSVQDNITGQNRDGYFNFASDGSYFTGTEGGDSGGPTLGSSSINWPASYNGKVTSHRHVLSTHQGCGSYSENCHDVPLAYNINVNLTPNQEYTVRLNQLWTRAAISDADQDGVPYQCDGDPSDPQVSTNSCPTALGTTDVDKPRGLLECKDGFVATGVKGRAGWLIDEMAVRCTPTSCLREDLSCAEEYWTDHFAGESSGGTQYTKTCTTGKVINYIRGQHTANVEVNEIAMYCYDYDALIDNGSYTGGQYLGVIGNSFGSRSDGGSPGWQTCGTDRVLVGFEARSDLEDDDVLSWITGLQPICSEPIKESAYHGSMGGELKTLKCPEGSSGVGFVAAPYSNNSDYVGLLGLLCLRDSDLGLTPSNYRLTVAHGSYYHGGNVYPAMVEKYVTFENRHGLGSSYVETKCPAGSVVTGAKFATNLNGSGNFINRFLSFKCRDTSSGSVTYQYPYVGQAGGDYAQLDCPSPSSDTVVGLNIDSGWLTDGVGVVCK